MKFQWKQRPKDLHRRLRAARAYAGLAQTDVAREFEVNRNTVRRWEAGELPEADYRLRGVLERYQEITGVEPWWFEVEEINLYRLFGIDSPSEDVDEAGRQAARDLDRIQADPEPHTGRSGDP